MDSPPDASAPAPALTPKHKRPSSMACDNCRRRKIRCDRGRPCRRYVEVPLQCAYTSIPRKKGPKGSHAPVLTFLRSLGTTALSEDLFLTAVTTTTTPTTTTVNAPIVPATYAENLGNIECLSPAPSLAISATSQSSRWHRTLSLTAPISGPAKPRVSSTVLGAHVNLFLQHLYAVMPVTDIKLKGDCANPEALNPQRYAYIVALSAVTHLQLNLDIGEYESPVDNIISGQELINEAIQALSEYDPLADPHIDTLLTMFFLFCAYGNLSKSGYAWHYLSQTISFLQILEMDREESYVGLPAAEANVRRRVFWLVFITERAYALLTGRPVILRSSIRKPSVLDSEVPALLYGFVSLAAVFEQMVPEFYTRSTNITGDCQEYSVINKTYHSLSSNPTLLDELSETQQVDIIITQQWLLVHLWKYLARRHPLSQRDPAWPPPLIPIQMPLIAGRAALACLSSASMRSVDAHGIGMEQKLFAIGEGITQLAPRFTKASPQLTKTTTPIATEIKDVVKSILSVLSATRGCESYLFATLVDKSQDLLQDSHIPVSLSTASDQVDLPGSRSKVPAEEQERFSDSRIIHGSDHTQQISQQHANEEVAEWICLTDTDLI